MAEKLNRLIRSPFFWILLFAALLRLPGLFWGLPASDGWDDDGIAPRNFLVGLAQTYTPGAHFTYPPLHMILLALLTLPGWLLAIFNAPSLHPHDVIAEIIHVPYMTFFAVVARLVSAVMSLATIYLVGRMAELIAGKRAGWFAAAACVINAAFTYYSQVSNLDGPYLFWSALSLLAWMRLIAKHDLKQVRYAALAAAAAVATKDQAYAIFILSIPAALAIWFVLDDWPQQNAKPLLARLLLWSGLSLFLLLLVDGAVTNPTGFAARIAFLAGSASQDYTQYSADWSGHLRLLTDMAVYFTRYYPLPFAVLAGLGIGVCVRELHARAPMAVAGLLPLLVIISFTVAFNLTALRSEVRFLLPQAVFLAVYAGVAADRIFDWPQPLPKLAARLFLGCVLVLGIYGCGGILAAFVEDPRYDAERWLAMHSGSPVETYGLNAYLPRFPAGAIVTRLDVKPARLRNPLPGVRDVDEPFGMVVARHPDLIVVSEFWVRDYLRDAETDPTGGRAEQAVKLSQAGQREPRAYFRALYGGKLPYRIAHRSQYTPQFWPAVEGYESIGQRVDIFAYNAAKGGQGPQNPPARIRN